MTNNPPEVKPPLDVKTTSQDHDKDLLAVRTVTRSTSPSPLSSPPSSSLAAPVSSSPTSVDALVVEYTHTYDSDEGPPARKPLGNLLWRLPCEESHSDYQIEITVLNDDEDNEYEERQCTPASGTNTFKLNDNDDGNRLERPNGQEPLLLIPPVVVYHVHKGILAAGSRNCGYFARLFRHNGRFVESISQKSCIKLHLLAAQAFPAMLDYIYQPKEPLAIETKTATALHFLGHYFENATLRWDAKKFWKEDLQYSNCHVYYEHAVVFQDDKILSAVVDTCVKQFRRIEPTSPILMVSDTAFFVSVLEELEITKETSRHASRLLAVFFDWNKEHLDAKTFHALTDVKYIPHIHELAAEDLLSLHDYFRDEYEDTVSCANSLLADSEEIALTSLQSRCVNVLAENWRMLATSVSTAADSNNSFHRGGGTIALIKRQPRAVLASLLTKTLQCANDEVRNEQEGKTKQEVSHKCPQHGPAHVYVMGAGTAAVNGLYHHEEHSEGPCRYVMKGCWNNQVTNFFIIKWTDDDWLICVTPHGVNAGVDPENDLYSCEGSADHHSPPQFGWESEELGADPAPMLKFITI